MSEVAHLGPFLKRTREYRGLTLPELAERSGVSKGNLSRIERGGDVQASTLKKLCDVLELRIQLSRESRSLEL